MEANKGKTIERLIERARTGKLSRRKFIAEVTAMGASTTALATLLAVIRQVNRPTAAHTVEEQGNLALHKAHLQRQQQRPGEHVLDSSSAISSPATVPLPSDSQLEHHIQRILQDYAEDAVVEDMLVGVPAVGLLAIAERKRAEIASMAGLRIEVSHRFAYGSQVVAEWVATGTHLGDFLSIKATGRSFNIRGLTVVTRHAGKISKESLYYDLSEVKRQLGL